MLDLFLIDYRGQAQDIIAFALCIAALIWGGAPERIVAATWLIVFELALWAKQWIVGPEVQLSEVDWFLAASDGVAGAIFLGVALYANRNYTLWIAAMQVLAVTAHLARGIADLIAPIAYAVMFVTPGWAQLLLLAAGLMRHVARKRRHGQYRDWRVRRPKVGIEQPSAALEGGVEWQQAHQPSWRDDLK